MRSRNVECEPSGGNCRAITRPLGVYESLVIGGTFSGETHRVNPGAALSLQKPFITVETDRGRRHRESDRGRDGLKT